jgi:hypothetical protein
VLGDCRFLQPPVPQEWEMEDVRWFHRWTPAAVLLLLASSHNTWEQRSFT